MVKANNDRLATAVLSMKIKYSQDRIRILKRQLCLLLIILKNIGNLIIAY